MQAISMKPRLISAIFANMEFSNPGISLFILRFYKHAQWQQIEIDDALPMDSQHAPLCATSEYFPFQGWPALIEKAYAKLHGSWEALGGGGHVEEALTDLTGGCATRYSTTDVAHDRLWQYLDTMMPYCVFAVNIDEGGCSRKQVPISKHWAAAIHSTAKHQGIPYVCVCTSAPTATLRHMPLVEIPSKEGYGLADGFAWLRIEDFVELFDTIYECRLVNSDLGPIQMGMPTPGWRAGEPWFEELWAFQGDVVSETAPSFFIDVREVPCEILLDVSQTDHRFGEQDEFPEDGRHLQAPLLLRFYQCSREVDEYQGGENYIVHMSAWGHTRDTSMAVKVLAPGKYLAMVSLPMAYLSTRMIFRSYSTRPIFVKPVAGHHSFICVHPAMPLNAIPYTLGGFQRVDTTSEKLPQEFDQEEGKGQPLMGWRKTAKADLDKAAKILHLNKQSQDGNKVVGKFGGEGAIATTSAGEDQAVACNVM
eukprot:NODE_2719_length_2158_cov_7.635647.p1 GENE.NODE_2719_length_2158_cov_7.635647~~NODE_2719_length_2158_cov_7.635647.p1  ORF type:complete len:479 (-),score=141.44 NODE_2719_length_2158_cov_7.635647:322-1758(-)